MIEIGDKIVSAELILRRFCCDLSKCKGTCCVEGDSGAPLEPQEVEAIKKHYPVFSAFMTPEGKTAVQNLGFSVQDQDGDIVTPLISGRECAYSYIENGVTKCAIEKAFVDGLIDFHKPISCHLYPLREVKFSNGTTGLQFHDWDVCKGAKELGNKLGLPVYKMLREPITIRYGAEFYDALEQVADELSK